MTYHCFIFQTKQEEQKHSEEAEKTDADTKDKKGVSCVYLIDEMK